MSEDWGHVFNGEATVKFWSPAAAQVLQQQHITKLRVHGWKQPTVEALGPFAHQLERIFWEVHDPTDVPDLSALAQLHQLNYLTLTHGLDQLTEVNVGEAPLKSLAGMNELRGLRRLALVQVPLASLDGIEDLQAIEDIYIHMLGRLQSIAPLTGLSRLKRLKLLQLDNVGPVPSLAFLRGLDKLETFYPSQGTKIEDGDLAVLLELPALTRVLFTNRKHYTHTCGDIQHALIARSTRDVGAFDNAASQIWFETLGQRNPVSWLGNTIGTALAFPPPKDVPALMAQYEIAAVELLALLAGRAGQGSITRKL